MYTTIMGDVRGDLGFIGGSGSLLDRILTRKYPGVEAAVKGK
jgi:hypothetical protein